MNKKEFIDRLSDSGNLSKTEKIEVCQYYIDNYPVLISNILTKLEIGISDGSQKAVDFAYERLRSRIKEFE
jgi:nucleoid DNA-binding protein